MPRNVSIASSEASTVSRLVVTSISLRRSKASATTPENSAQMRIARNLNRPTRPSASGRERSSTSSATCQSTAAFCIIEPAVDTSWPTHSKR